MSTNTLTFKWLNKSQNPPRIPSNDGNRNKSPHKLEYLMSKTNARAFSVLIHLFVNKSQLRKIINFTLWRWIFNLYISIPVYVYGVVMPIFPNDLNLLLHDNQLNWILEWRSESFRKHLVFRTCTVICRSNRYFNFPSPGKPRAFACFVCPGTEEFDLWGGGYLIFAWVWSEKWIGIVKFQMIFLGGRRGR